MDCLERNEKAGLTLSVYDLLKMHISDTLPVACTKDFGHGHDAKAIIIGKEYQTKENLGQYILNPLLYIEGTIARDVRGD